MAQDAQLLLKVGLDLSTFRNQLATLGQAAAGYNLPIKLKFDRTVIKNELNNLQRFLGRKKFNIELNIVGGLTKDQFEKIQTRLDALSKTKAVEIPVSIRSAVTQKDVLSVVSGINKTIKGSPALENAGGKIRIGTSIKPSITQADVRAFKKAVTESLGGISVNVKANVQGGKGGMPPGFPDLMEYMRTQGMVGKTASGMEMRMRNEPGGGQLERVLDTFARGVFRMLGMDPAAMLEQARRQRMPPAINWPAVAGSAQRPPIGPSSTGRLLAGAAPLLSIGASRPAAGLLPSVTRQSELTAGLKVLMQALSAQSQGAGTGGPAGAIVSMESGFITAMRERFAKAAERYLFGIETQVVDLFDTAIRQVEVAVDQYIAKIQAQISQRARQSVSVVDLGSTIQRLLPGGSTGRNPLMLPSAGGTTPIGQMRFNAVKGGTVVPPQRLMLPAAGESGGMLGTPTTVTGGGVTPRGGFPTDGPLFMGKQGPATLLSSDYFENARKYNAALDIARATSAKFTASQIPLIGGLREVAGEFGFAIKQVLLFGTAYKGLAFVTSLPGQILDAAKSQQQYNNSLKTATQDTGTFAKELLYVDNVQRAFGLNLETTRTGFTRLYASMAPTGFDSGSIEKLFTGISAATAALQLTPDRAERVIYAFGQMASKGQIMSEELKGQLGDVLPGALAIFAKAAGMSVKEFSKAMEDGVFVGGKFREVFAKVSDELMTRFGTGAQAAGKSLQGLLNTIGGDFQRTLESFAPLANSAAQAVLVPLGSALRQLSTSAQIAMGEMERVQGQLSTARQDVSNLRAGGASANQIRAAEQNVAALEVRYRSLNEALKDPAVAKQVKDLQLLVQELSNAGTFVMNVAKTIGNMLAPALNFLGTNLTSVIATITAFYVGFQAARLAAMALMGVLLLYRGLSALLGFGAAAQQATALAGAFNVLGVAATRATTQMVGLRLALTALVASTVIGAVVGGIVMIAGAFATMSDKAKDAAQSSRDAAKAAVDAAAAGNVAGAAMSVQTVLAESRKAASARQALESIYARSTPTQRGGIVPVTISSKESVALQGTALTSGMIQPGVKPGGARQIRVPSGPEMRTLRGQFGNLAGQQAIDLREAKEAVRQAEEVNKRLGLNKPMPGPAALEAPSVEGGKKGAADKAAKAAERAAQQARELKATLEQLREQLDIERKSLELQEAIAFARADGNEKLVGFLQTQEKFYDIDEKSSKLQKDFVAGKIKQAELSLRQQLLAIEKKKVEITEEERLNAILRERFGITSEVQDAARRARINAFSMGLGGAGTFRTDLNLMPELTGDQFGDKLAQAKKDLTELLNTANQVAGAAAAIGGAFGDSFKGVVSGAMTAQQALANFFQSVGDYFLDMAAKMIAKWMEVQLVQGLGSFISGLFGGGASSIFGAGGAPDYSGAFGASGPSFRPKLFASTKGGITPFAGGGLVTGPTMALVGEGRFNEAIVPLPNGKSIPVELGGSAGNQIVSNITVNVNNGQMQSNGGASSAELTRKLEGAVKQVIIGELRPGGVLSGRG